MNFYKKSLFLIFLIGTSLFSNTKEVDTLLEEVNKTTSVIERKMLIEDLKIKLANANKKAREETDAIIKARQKIPTKNYNDSLLKK